MRRGTHGLDLRDRGLVGDRSAAALVAGDATIDWYCPGRFDSSPALSHLLDRDTGGSVRLGPPESHAIAGVQSYDRGGAPVLRTQLRGSECLVDVADHLLDGRIVRIATVLRGPATIALDVVPGDAWGIPRSVQRWSGGVAFGRLVVRAGSGCPEPGELLVLDSGERAVMCIDPDDERGIVHAGPQSAPLRVDTALKQEAALARSWRRAVAEMSYGGPYREIVERAVMVLRLLTDRTNGALVRSVTTSLPAALGNERNTDGRYAWLRDNARLVVLWERLDLREWADQTREWLAARATDELPLAPMVRIDGERLGSELELSAAGWRDTGPVRERNRAADGLDLGAMAELTLALDDRRSWRELERLGDWLAEHWRRPDQGRWDNRSRPQLLVESKIAVHAALEALVATARRRNPLDPDLRGWTDAVADLDVWLRVNGLFGALPRTGWRRTLGDDSSDAAALRWLGGERPALRGDDSAEAPLRLHVSIDQTLAQLGEGAFIHRHLPHVDDGFPPGQGADVAASFEAVSVLSRAHRWEEAHDRMEALVSWADAGPLLSAHVDRFTGDARGNLPWAPAYMALIEAALSLTAGPR